jgi:hypothetical protein
VDLDDSPALEIVHTNSTDGLHEQCDQCGIPIAQPGRRRIRRRRFCSPTCRARWHRMRKAALQAEAADLLRRTAAIIEELAGPRR